MSHTVEVYSRELDVPKLLKDESIEEYLRKTYPGVQIRFCGLGCGEFPHPKRIPYISADIDGCGYLLGATMYYIK